MGNRNRGTIRKFPVKKGKLDQLHSMVSTVADEIVSSFNEMISSKVDALNWAIDQLPEMERAAGIADVTFTVADGIFPFLLSGFTDLDDEEEDEDEDEFGGLYPCFSADEDLPAGIEEYILLLAVSEDEDGEEGSHRIDAFLARRESEGDLFVFDGEDWVAIEEMVEEDEIW